MISNEVDPPTFPTSTGSPSLYLSPLPDGRADTQVDFWSGLSNVILDSKRYYVPTATNDRLKA